MIIGTKSIATSPGLKAMTEFCRATNPNNPTASRVGAGLRSLSALSTALGKGGKLPASIDSINSNVKWVLGTVGIDSQTLFKIGDEIITDPATGEQRKRNIAETATEAAKQVFDRVKKGQFKIEDIQIFGPPLQEAYDIIRMNTDEAFNQIGSNVVNMHSNTPYAVDLDRALPKYKFIFVVQFIFNDPYLQDPSFQREFTFMIKKATRPGVTYKLEDVNYYNFRTQVKTQTELDEMSMEFYDDGVNSVHALYDAYTKATTPVLNYGSSMEAAMMESDGTTFAPSVSHIQGIQGPVPMMNLNSASLGPLADDNKNIIREIKLYHVYDNGLYTNIYTFINPRITSFTLDDVDMTSMGDPCAVNLKYKYDSVFTESAVDLRLVNTIDLTSFGIHPLRYVGDGFQMGELGNGGVMGNMAHNNCFDNVKSTASSVIDTVKSTASKVMGKLFG